LGEDKSADDERARPKASFHGKTPCQTVLHPQSLAFDPALERLSYPSRLLQARILSKMTFNLTWFDVLLTILSTGIIVISARRGVAGLVAGVAMLFLWPILNLLGRLEPLLGFVLALAGGWAVGLLSRYAYATGIINATSDVARALLGGLGGVLMGAALMVVLALSFPITSTPSAGQGAFSYPSDALPNWLRQGVDQSAIQRFLSEPPTSGGLGLWRNSALVKLFVVPDRSGR
jgi:hypothetical protein